MTSRRGAALATSVVLVLAGCSDATSTGDQPGASDPVTDTIEATSAASTPASTAVSSPASTVPTSDGVDPGEGQPQGFTTITARITEPDGTVCEVCVWLADTPDERSRGLMDVSDLGEASGMVFAFDEPLIGSFYMFDTPTPLSIAWFLDGDLVGTADMDPCLDTPAGECPRYSPDTAYDLALEVFDGGLDGLGLGSGASLELVSGTEAPRCRAVTGTTP